MAIMDGGRTVHVVDDDALVRDGLKRLLEQEAIAVESHECAEAFLAVCRTAPRCCVLAEMCLPRLDGMELLADMAWRKVCLPVIFMTTKGDLQTCVKAIKAGAVDFLPKPIKPSTLIHCVDAAMKESERIGQQSEAHLSARSLVADLTPRERDVMVLVAQGLAVRQIARWMDISCRAVEFHKARVMRKTGADTPIDLGQLAEASGIRVGRGYVGNGVKH
jgi:two-component system response regulator FixJ